MYADLLRRKDAKLTHQGASLDDIMKSVSNETGISEHLIKSRRRKSEITFARHLFCYLSKRFTADSLKSIGNYVGGRDHTTAIHANSSLQDLIDTEPETAELVMKMKRTLKLRFKPYRVEPIDMEAETPIHQEPVYDFETYSLH